MEDSTKLLIAYQQLWSNRSLKIEGVSETELLKEAIKVELKDELTHPRTRKQPIEKYFLAIKRITNSNLEDSDQLLLIKQFNHALDSLQAENKKRS
ncbi:hypothetical protein [Sutcliffiella halmapala]|uniref:hypothetical protein n=1 Tax=Sutcliffiella halmapala TaxID=79882 RepID=UPI000995D1BE|nr:hypothetical protein [Sutcliffiella halmapala]